MFKKENFEKSFRESLVPGNYWITKSMEINKVTTSGTLWYMKKWFVWYYYIFLKKGGLFANDYKTIATNFENFINSLDKSVQEDARNFFFNIDFTSEQFLTFERFSKNTIDFANKIEKQEWLTECKKFYFMYVMGTGGQQGYKKKIRELLEQQNTYQDTIASITKLIKKDGKSSKYIEGQLTDFHAGTLRNERQIFFYYGFFHGKESADLSGFYKLTPIGKALLEANFHELLIIWEHQKLRMISQSPITDINNLVLTNTFDKENFSINRSPYFTLIEILNAKGFITQDEYKYIISRTNSKNIEGVIEYLKSGSDIDFIKSQIETFKRTRDTSNEDFDKERKKYILGISDFKKDLGTNYYSILDSNGLKVNNLEKCNFIYNCYKKINNYIQKKNNYKYNRFEVLIKQYYKNSLENSMHYKKDKKIIYEWNKHIINFDKDVLINLIYIGICMKNNCLDFNLDINFVKQDYYNYNFLVKEVLGYNRKDFIDLMNSIQNCMKNHEYVYLLQNNTEDVNYYTENTTQINIDIDKLQEVSYKNIQNYDIYVNRKRSMEVKNSIKNYYISKFRNTTTNLIKCDCCGDYTFITEQGIPYLEYHHLIPFSTDFGPDHYLNLFGICPSCHRKFHYQQTEERVNLYEMISKNNNMGISIIERIKQLYKQDLLEPIAIEFLNKENAITEEEYEALINKSI